jgi:hypothetical protein
MANKYLSNASGALQEVEASASSAGVGDAGKIVALDTSGKLDNSLMPTGIGAETKLVAASENLSAGDWVNIYLDSTAKCRKADASDPAKRVHGFVLGAVTAPANATIYLEGINNQISSLTVGAMYFLSGSSAGAETATAPTTTGYIVQEVGVAISDTEISFEPSKPIILA